MIIGLSALLAALVLVGMLVTPTVWFAVRRNHFDLGLGIKMIQISDIHIERMRAAPKRIKRVIDKEKPNFIALTGDYLDEESHFEKLERFLQTLRCDIPVYAVLGNHDYLHQSQEELDALFKRNGARLLRNESIEWAAFNLIGIDDYGTDHADADKAYTDAKANKQKLIMTHDPNLALALNHPCGAMIAGHLHGKQFNVPFMKHFVSLGELPNLNIWGGRHMINGVDTFISRGLGQSGYNFRFLVRSEIVIHTF